MTMPSTLDTKLCRELANHIETLTHTGQKILDVKILKKVKSICKSNERYVGHAYHLLLHQLKENHAEVRFSAFQIIDVLFRRSHCFRELLVSDLQQVMELTAETSPNHHLPPPHIVAVNLKHLALTSFHEWNTQYGSGYKKLQIGYNFLKKCKNVDFNTMDFENAIQRARIQEREQRQNVVNEEKIKHVLAEYNELHAEIRNALTSLENCLELLVPSLDEFFISTQHANDSNNEVSENETSNLFDTEENKELDNTEDEHGDIMREHGMLNSKFSVEVEIKPVTDIKETVENTAVFENTRDLHKLMTSRYLPCIKKWLQVLTKCSGSSDDMKKVVNLKEAIENSLKKCDRLNISVKIDCNTDSSDSDLEEVPEKEGYEENAVHEAALLQVTRTETSAENKKQWNIFSHENHEKDPTTLLSTISSIKAVQCMAPVSKTESQSEEKPRAQKVSMEINCKPSTSRESSCQSRKDKLLAVAPKLPFDIDLYHWEEENLKAPTMLMVKPDGARFWSATSTDEMEEIAVPGGSASLRTRVIEFSGQHEPVKWTCRAPLPSGKLCPRRDRHKCPFHGPIVARDNTGKCTNPEDVTRLKDLEEQKQQLTPDWQDPQLLKEIKEATGIDLKMPEKGKRKKRIDETKYPGLTDIKAKQNNTYTRLAKKVFKKSAMKRVAEVLDNADHKRYRDKFGDQFNYVHETS